VRRAAADVTWVWWLRARLYAVIDGRRTACQAYYDTKTRRVDVALFSQRNARELYETCLEELLHHLGWSDPQAGRLAHELVKDPRARKIVRDALRKEGFRV
jgi:hypothetical protein